MPTLPRALKTAIFISTTLCLQANDFHPLMTAVKETWPGKTHIGVICNMRLASDQVRDLASAAGPEMRITVVDARAQHQLPGSVQRILSAKAHYLVLMPEGGLVQDGSMEASLVIRKLAQCGVPTLGTRTAALQQGALFVAGPETGGAVLVSDRLPIGTIDVILPKDITILRKAALPFPELRPLAAEVQVIPFGP